MGRTTTRFAISFGTAWAVLLLAWPVKASQQLAESVRAAREQNHPSQGLQNETKAPLTFHQTAEPTYGEGGSTRIRIDDITLEGNTLYSDSVLLDLLGDAVGDHLGLADMHGLAARLTAFYRKNGYVFARAYLPAQKLQHNALKIQIIEGHIAKIRVHNASNLPDVFLSRLLWAGDPLRTADLEHSLLTLSDVPGIAVSATLEPGDSMGTSDLFVDIDDGKGFRGAITADTYGSHHTGENRISASLTYHNPFRRAGNLAMRASVTDGDMLFGGVNYQTVVGYEGVRVGGSYARVDYALGNDFESLDAHGTADVVSLNLLRPFVRSRSFNLYGKASTSAKWLRDYVDLYSITDEKRSLGATLTLYGNNRDGLWGGGASSFSLGITGGNLRIESGAAEVQDDLTAQTAGGYATINTSLLRSQRLSDAISLHLVFSGQLASRNLTSAEKFSLGGPYGVRAYPQGEATGDEGLLGSFELHYAPTPRLDFSLFADAGAIRINKDPWSPGDNHRELYGYGVGVKWSTRFGLHLEAYAAWKIGDELPTTDADRSPRVWGQVAQYF